MRLFGFFISVILGLYYYDGDRGVNTIKPVIFEERDGIVVVESEHYYEQTLADIRKWYIIDKPFASEMSDPDDNHASDASGSAYLESLPDTRTTHYDKLIHDENFCNQAGKMAVVHFKVHFNNPGKYYVWVRAYSTGAEDNGIHVGLDGEWPESGQRMQWCEGKNQWTWDSKQRTDADHCGVSERIFLEVKNTGLHDIQFSMRKDGFEFDKFVLTKSYKRPIEYEPDELLKVDN